MIVRVSTTCAAMAVCLLLVGTSCRREQAQSAGKAQPAASTAVSTSAPPALDTNLLAAIVARQQAERSWRTSNPEAAAAFKRLADAEAAYTASLSPFGLYSLPAAERDAAMNALTEAREKGDADRIAAAEKALEAANARAEEGASRLRSGNPSIQKAYDEWLAARQAYTALRDRDETISKAAENMTQLMETSTPFENDRNDPKEN